MPVKYEKLEGFRRYPIDILTENGNCYRVDVQVQIGICGSSPIANDDIKETDCSTTTIYPLFNDSDPDGDSFAICAVQNADNGSIEFSDSEIYYTPESGFNGDEQILYTICDETGSESTAIITVIVNCPIDCENPVGNYCAEVAVPLFICPDFCQFSTDDYNITELYSLFECSLTLTGDGCIRYVALPGFSGVETVNIMACDYDGNCYEKELQIFVGDCEENLAPEAQSDTYEINCENIFLDVLANDSDGNGDELIICDFSQTNNGELNFSMNGFYYEPVFGFSGNDSFEYTVCDGSGGSSSTIVDIEIDCEIPCSANQVLCAQPQIPEIFCIEFCNESAGISQIHFPTALCDVTYHENQCFQFAAFPAYYGEIQIEVEGCDNNGNCEDVLILFEVKPLCDDTETNEDEGLNKGYLELSDEYALRSAFSPNGDGRNETIEVEIIEDAFPKHAVLLEIFKSNGESLIQLQNQDWDGCDAQGNAAPQGTYFYYLQVTSDRKKITNWKRGFIELRR